MVEGNIGKTSVEAPQEPKDFTTPTIKQEVYTTGRGGSGNMAKNDPEHPEVARAAQDVESPPPREQHGGFHVGRGGAANVAKAETDNSGNTTELQQGEQGLGMGVRRESKGLADRGKELLGKIGIGEKK
ncbi:MAG: hypothetical protein M1820_006525 [Bogoriella megaspora]|nr:MAG: hypothetical protein M1820_006525 [Bogoriella megaspora]